MEPTPDFEVIIAGGGLGGLVTALVLNHYGHKVAIIESKSYPFHRVCGEYISLEVWDFLESLGLPLNSMKLPQLEQLNISTPSGRILATDLPLGGFGISRYMLDATLAELAQSRGITIIQQETVEAINVINNVYTFKLRSGKTLQSKLAIAAHGKRSNLDVAFDRPFIKSRPENRYNQYVGVKWHLETPLPKNLIELHNFSGGYAGISAIENERFCFCYLTTAHAIKKAGGSIELLEQNTLGKNPILKQYLTDFKKVWEKPLVISQVSFEPKSSIEQGIWQVGDSAGLIAPLCGNGMSMAIRAAHLAGTIGHQFLSGQRSKKEADYLYQTAWQNNFNTRLWVGRQIQATFGNPLLTELVIGTFKTLPFFVKPLIRLTHGKVMEGIGNN